MTNADTTRTDRRHEDRRHEDRRPEDRRPEDPRHEECHPEERRHEDRGPEDRRPDVVGDIDGGEAEQLTLLPPSNVHARFRLSRATRERGLRHVAEIRRQLAEAKAAHEHENVHRLPPRHDEAA